MSIQNYIHDAGTLGAAAAIQGAAVPDLTKRIIRAATIANPTGGPVAAYVYLVPKGGAPDASNVMIVARTIAAGESYPCQEIVNQGLNAGGSVQAFGTGLVFKYAATDFT